MTKGIKSIVEKIQTAYQKGNLDEAKRLESQPVNPLVEQPSRVYELGRGFVYDDDFKREDWDR